MVLMVCFYLMAGGCGSGKAASDEKFPLGSDPNRAPTTGTPSITRHTIALARMPAPAARSFGLALLVVRIGFRCVIDASGRARRRQALSGIS